MEIDERLNKAISFLKDEGLVRTNRQVADKMNVDNANLSKALKGDSRYLTKNFLERFNNAFGKIFSMVWLEKGEGDFLLDKTYHKYMEQHISGTPYYNISFSDFSDEKKEESFDSKIHCVRFNTATLWCNITGDAMSPIIQHGDTIALRELKNTQYVIYDEVYAVSLSNGMNVVRKLSWSKNVDNIILTPLNGRYLSQEIPISSIKKIYSVIGLLRNI